MNEFDLVREKYQARREREEKIRDEARKHNEVKANMLKDLRDEVQDEIIGMNKKKKAGSLEHFDGADMEAMKKKRRDAVLQRERAKRRKPLIGRKKVFNLEPFSLETGKRFGEDYWDGKEKIEPVDTDHVILHFDRDLEPAEVAK